MTKLYQLTISLIVLFSVIARIVCINRIPPAIFIDEYNLAVPAAQIALGHSTLPWSGFGWYATPGLFFYYVALIFKIVGISVTSIKFAWLIPATFSLPLVYLMGKDLFKSRFVGAVSLLIFGFNVVAVHIARWGHGSVITATFQLVTLYLFWLAEESKNHKSYVFAGLSALIAGMSLYFYVGARSFILLLPIYFVWFWIFSQHTNRKKVSILILFFVIILLVSLPMIFQITKNQFSFIWRLQEVSIIQKEVPVMTNITQLVNNLVIYLKVIFDAVDNNLRHNPLSTTLFPFYLGLFVPIGITVMILKKTVRKQSIFLAIGLLITMAGGIFSKEAPSYFRIFGSIPLMAICIAAAFFYLLKLKIFTKKVSKGVWIEIVLFILLSGGLITKLVSYYQFMLQPTTVVREAFSFPEQVIAETIVQFKNQNRLVYIAADYLYSSTIFLTLPKNAFSEYLLFDVDSLLTIDQPAVLVLESSGRGLQQFLETNYSITRQFEIQTDQFNLPIVYEITPKEEISAQSGLTVVCDDGRNQILQKRSLGIFHSFSTFPENIVHCFWSGKLTIAHAGDYQFSGSADDGLSLQLASTSGNLVIDQPLATKWLVSATLEVGTYELSTRYQNTGGARAARLEWLQPGDTKFTVVDPLAFIQAENYE